MSADEFTRSLAELIQAGRALREQPRSARIRRLGTILEGLLAPQSDLIGWASEIAESTGYATPMVEVCLRRSLAAWNDPALTENIATAESAPGEHAAPDLIAAILAQNTPGLAIGPIVTALALGSAVVVKSARGEPHFAERFVAAIRAKDPILGAACAAWVWQGGDPDFENPLAEAADRILVYGDRATIASWRERAGERVVAHGPRISLALVGDGLDAAGLTALAEDIAFLDGRGCLSPQAILTTPEVDATRLGAGLARELELIARQWPRRRLAGSAAAGFRQAVASAEMALAAGAAGALFGGHAAGFAIEVRAEARTPARESASALEPSPLDRFIRIYPLAGAEALAAALRPLRENLECIGVGGAIGAPFEATLRRAGVPRICQIGSMQDPPAAWQPAGPFLHTRHDERPGAPGDLPERFRRVVAQTSEAPRALEVVRARGAHIFTSDGQAHLDLLAGIGVASVGHAHPRVAAAVARQARLYTHVMVYGEDALAPQVELAERLTARLPAHLEAVYFTNSGTEAIEGALKLVRKATGRTRVLSFEGAFHGDTTGSVALGGNPLYREPFRPLIEGIEQIPWNDVDALARIDETTAAVFAEPVQAEAGVRLPAADFLPRLRARCTEVGALLVFDEVVTAFGRTGRFWGFEHWPEAAPDVLVLAKSLGGGLPLGAFIASHQLLASLSSDPPLGHVTTFGGNPVCCAAALAALDVLEEEALVERSARVGALFLEELRALVGHGGLVEVRGLGMLLGLEFATPQACLAFAEACRARHLLLGWTLHEDRVIRLAPPLILSDPERRHAVTEIRAALA
ncbi:MAG: aminotransferase class III-fold pyridoxal phosphate-dependent enzyme [Deltaproteobacteria bacterium]